MVNLPLPSQIIEILLMQPVDNERTVVFISKATPEDDDFALWLAPKLEGAGYTVFADILNLDVGDRWRKKITQTLQNKAVKMVLCCSDETLNKDGVEEEIGIALDLSKELNDKNFLLPLKVRRFKKLFGIGGLQYIDFENSWSDGLRNLLDSLEKQNVPKTSKGVIQPQWEQYKRRNQVAIQLSPETLTSNWLRIISIPDHLNYIEPINPFNLSRLLSLGRGFEYPVVPFNRGFLTYASPFDLVEHFSEIGPFKVTQAFDTKRFMEFGAESPLIQPFDAKNKMTDLIRQAWQKHCLQQGFYSFEYSGASGFHVGEDKAGINKRISWGRQGERRLSVLRNKARGKLWEYGVSGTPSLFPYPHIKLKGRVLFSDLQENRKPLVIKDAQTQHRLRRTICSGWRNKAWHGRLMAFMELLAGASPYVELPVGADEKVILDAMPVQFTSPVSTILPDEGDGEELDETTLAGVFEEVVE